MAKSIALAADASRRLASLRFSYIPAVCAFVAPRQPGASTAIIDRLSHLRSVSATPGYPAQTRGALRDRDRPHARPCEWRSPAVAMSDPVNDFPSLVACLSASQRLLLCEHRIVHGEACWVAGGEHRARTQKFPVSMSASAAKRAAMAHKASQAPTRIRVSLAPRKWAKDSPRQQEQARSPAARD
jgi:hypothetical protein